MADAKDLVVPPATPVVSTTAPSTSPLMVNKPNVLPVRAKAPRRFSAGLVAQPPVGATFQGLGATMVEGPQSVAATVRSRKESYVMADGVPVTGQYVSEIKAMAAGGSAISQKTMPKQGYAAAGYTYADPNRGRVGSTLQGAPGFVPKMVKKSRYYIPVSVAEERRRQVATLMGLGNLAGEFADTPKYKYSDSDFFKTADRSGCLLSVSNDANANQTFATECTLSIAAAEAWTKYCNETYATDGNLRRLCKIVSDYAPAPPWSVVGKTQRGLPQDAEQLMKAAKEAAQVVKDQLPASAPPVNPPVNMTQMPPSGKINPFGRGGLNPLQRGLVNKGFIPDLKRLPTTVMTPAQRAALNARREQEAARRLARERDAMQPPMPPAAPQGEEKKEGISPVVMGVAAVASVAGLIVLAKYLGKKKAA